MPRKTAKTYLRELTIHRLKRKKSAYLVWDAKQAGLAIRVQPTGSKSWTVIYSRQGRPRWLHLGKVETMSLSEARTEAMEILVKVRRGGDPAAEKRAERGAGTFAELADRYLEEHAKKRNKSWKQGRTLVERFALPRWGQLQAASITYDDVSTLTGKIAAPITANQALAAISAVFSWGVKRKIIPSNPCRGVERNETKSRERVLANSEVPQFWTATAALDQVSGAALRAILLTGQRPGEVAHLRYEHIKDGWWELPGDPVKELGWPGTKNGQTHRVWLAEPVRALFPDAAAGFVFAGPRGGAVTELDASMREVCSKLGIDRATPHDLRRTFSSTVTRLGFGRDAMNRVTNHREGGIADVYDRHRYEAENQQIMTSVAAHLMVLAEGRGASNVVSLR
jgi:integrase